MKPAINLHQHVTQKPGAFVFLQILRGLAASWVCFYHFTTLTVENKENIFFNIAGQGTLGVFVFFVISGYVIAFSADKNIETPKIFLINRVSRIYPPYLGAFLLILALSLISIQFTGKSLYELTRITLIDYVGNILLISNLYPTPAYLNGIFWTLCYEMQFYVFVYIVIRSVRKQYTSLFIALTILHLILLTVSPNPFYARYSIFFFIGFLLYRLHRREHVVVSSLLIIYFTGLSWVRYSQDQSAEYLTGAMTALTILMTKPIDYFFRRRIFIPLIFIGGISYSLYLIHDTIGSRIIHAVSLKYQLTTTTLMLLAISAYLLVAFCAFVFYIFFEVGASNYFKSRLLSEASETEQSGQNPHL